MQEDESSGHCNYYIVVKFHQQARTKLNFWGNVWCAAWERFVEMKSMVGK